MDSEDQSAVLTLVGIAVQEVEKAICLLQTETSSLTVVQPIEAALAALEDAAWALAASQLCECCNCLSYQVDDQQIRQEIGQLIKLYRYTGNRMAR